MNKFSKKKNTIKKGGDCDYTRSQFTKVKSVLGPDGLEGKISNELHKSLTGINDYLENFLQKKIRHLQQIFNSNTDRKGEILNIIKQLEEKLIDVEQKNKSCYDELIVDPRGDEFGTKTSDAKMIELFGENPDEYSAAQANYIDHLLDDHPIVGINPSGVPPPAPSSVPDVDSAENMALEEILQEEEQSTIPAWQKIDKKKDAVNKIFKLEGDNQKYNFIEIRSKLGDYLKTLVKKTKNEEEQKTYDELRNLHTKLVQDYSSFEESSFQTDIIDTFKLHVLANKTTRGGRKSKRTNKTRKYRSRRQ